MTDAGEYVTRGVRPSRPPVFPPWGLAFSRHSSLATCHCCCDRAIGSSGHLVI